MDANNTKHGISRRAETRKKKGRRVVASRDGPALLYSNAGPGVQMTLICTDRNRCPSCKKHEA